MDILLKIKRFAIQDRLRYATKASEEMDVDGLATTDVVESLVNAQRIDKIIRSRSGRRSRPGERLYVIKSFNYTGTLIYTKGRFGRAEEGEVFYILISAKLSTTN